MGFRLIRNVVSSAADFENPPIQQLDVNVVLPADTRKVIHGTVRDEQGNPVACAVVKFFKVNSGQPTTTCDLTPIGHAITDDCGQFLLGPLEPPFTVVWKVFKLINNARTVTATNFAGTCESIDPPTPES